MALELIAPAKLNLTLEVLGRRPDGYHEIVSLMQTIDLADRVLLSPAPDIELVVGGEFVLGVPSEGPRNLAYRAAELLREEAGRLDLGAVIELDKRIPAGLGLGGGSSDAAAVLRGLDRLWGLGLEEARLAALAARAGSDVPFFLPGGTALVTGRGEIVEPLPDLQACNFTLFVSDIEVDDKTRRMYATLAPSDYSDGGAGRRAAQRVRHGLALGDADLVNAFDRHIGEVAPPSAHAMALCRDAGLAVWASGSGPGFYCKASPDELPDFLLHELERQWGVRPLACRSLERAGALTAREV